MIYLNRNIGCYVTWTCKTIKTSQQRLLCQGERKHSRRPWKAGSLHSSHRLRGSSLWKHVTQRVDITYCRLRYSFRSILLKTMSVTVGVTVGVASLAPAASLDHGRFCEPMRTWQGKRLSCPPEALLCLCIRCGVSPGSLASLSGNNPTLCPSCPSHPSRALAISYG